MRGMIVVAAALGLSLTACNSSVPFQGVLNGQPITGALSGSELTMTNGRDLSCSGPLSFTTPSTGAVTLRCTNGQTGSATFFSSGGSGTATGAIGGKPFSASFKAG